MVRSRFEAKRPSPRREGAGICRYFEPSRRRDGPFWSNPQDAKMAFISNRNALAKVSNLRGAHFRPICSPFRSEEHTSELQSLMRISSAAFCLKKKILKIAGSYDIWQQHSITQSTYRHTNEQHIN